MIDEKDILAIPSNRLRRLASFASLGVATVLIAAKLGAYLATDSVAMLTSLFDSIFDLVASLVTAFGIASAMRPPDENHRFGHGKAEPLAALAQAIFIMVSSGILAAQAISRFYHPQDISNDVIGYGVMALAVVLTIGLVSLQHHVISKTGSTAIGADRLHYVGDLGINVAVVAAFVLQRSTGLVWFDPLFALVMVLGLVYSSVHILKQALLSLMDAELPEAQRQQIIAIVKRQPGVHGMHDMRTRSDGDRIFIELHAEMDGSITLNEAHQLAEKIAQAVRVEFPSADVLVHQDPGGHIDQRLDTQIKRQAQ